MNLLDRPRETGYFLLFSLVLAYPVLSFLWRREYPVLSAEVGLLFVGVFSLAILLVFLNKHVGDLVFATIVSTVVTLSFLIQFNMLLIGLISTFSVTFFLSWKWKDEFYRYAPIILLIMLTGAFLDSLLEKREGKNAIDREQENSGLPPVIHVVLDGFVGLDGLPGFPASVAFAESLRQFQNEFGFRLYSGAYSRYSATAPSLRTAMNFSNDPDHQFLYETRHRQDLHLRTNRYFEAFTEANYRLNIYQTPHLGLCQSHASSTDRCKSYYVPNVSTILEVHSASRRAGMLARVLLAQSRILIDALQGKVSDPAISVFDSRILDQLEEDFYAQPDGGVFFIHLLVPHNPFVFMHDCSIRYEDNPALSYALVPSIEQDVDIDLVEYRTYRYFEQADCALQTIAGFLRKMKSNGLFDRSLVIVHGDHGSQVSKNYPSIPNRDRLDSEDYKAHFSTLFAVKYPFGNADTIHQMNSLDRLLEELGKFTAQINSARGNPDPIEAETGRPFVYLMDEPRIERVEIEPFTQYADQ